MIIGGGPSGKELSRIISKTARHVTLSVRKARTATVEALAVEQRQNELKNKISIKNEVLRFTPTGAVFVDGTNETFDTVIFATGMVI